MYFSSYSTTISVFLALPTFHAMNIHGSLTTFFLIIFYTRIWDSKLNTVISAKLTKIKQLYSKLCRSLQIRLWFHCNVNIITHVPGRCGVMTWGTRWQCGTKEGVPGWYPWWWQHGTQGENCVKWPDFFRIKENSVLWKYLKPNLTAPSKNDSLWSSKVRDVRMNQCTQIKYVACYINRIKGKTWLSPLSVENDLTKFSIFTW